MTEAQGLITRHDIQNIREQTKRRWKVILVLLALVLKVKGLEKKVNKLPEVEEAEIVGIPIILLLSANRAFSNRLGRFLESEGLAVKSYSPLEDEVGKSLNEAELIIMDDSSEYMSTAVRWFSDAPIIVLSANPDAKAWVRAATRGIDAYLDKSISQHELVARIKAILRRYHHQMSPTSCTENEEKANGTKHRFEVRARVTSENR